MSVQSEVFKGFGKIFDKKNNEEFLVKFSMKPDATPIAQKPRPVPYYLQEPLRKWLDQRIQEEIFEKVEPGEPVTWCSPLVVQPKPRFSKVNNENLEPHMIRASVALRVPNRYMERNRILQAPVVEDFTCKFHDRKIFSKMDLKQGYHQLLLHPDSRDIALKQVITAAHSMGHFGMTRTKQMLRAKYWFSKLNGMVEDAISKCYQCQLCTVEHRQEPVKPSEIPDVAWHKLSVDFGGPYPDGHYNLVVIDKRTRFPAVEQTTSTSCRATCDRLRKIFATHGIPERLETDNGPPFNSTDFQKFAEEMGFKHHRVTPEHPRANGEAESFMKVLNKTEQIAHSEGRSSNSALQYMLMGYRSTPHPATGYCPYEALMKRNVRTKLDHDSFSRGKDYHKMEREITNRDREYKRKWESQHRHPKVKKHRFKMGDRVLLKKRKHNKWSSAYEKEYYRITDICGSAIEARRKSDGCTIRRDASKYRLLREAIDTGWRERLLRSPGRKQSGKLGAAPTQEERNEEREAEEGQERPNREEYKNQQHDVGTERLHDQQSEIPRRQLPPRTRRLPTRLKDYILDFNNRETEL